MQIENSTFLVSGGASGLGAATVRMLVAGGAKVLIADINQKAGEALAAELGAQVRFAATDVIGEASVQAAIGAAVELGGSLRGVIHCAGIVIPRKVLDKDGTVHPLDLFAKGVEVNLVGTFNVTRLAAKSMRENTPDGEGERGIIVNTASIAAFEGQIGQACYSASKAGVVGMTLPLARELARFGIRVMTIAPGVFETPMGSEVPEAVRESLAGITLFPPRLGRPPEFAVLVRHVIENVMLNGGVIRIDGSVRLPPK